MGKRHQAAVRAFELREFSRAEWALRRPVSRTTVALLIVEEREKHRAVHAEAQLAQARRQRLRELQDGS